MKKIELQLKNLRLVLGHKIEKVATMVDKSPSTISRFENSKSKIDLEFVRKLCEIYEADFFCIIIPKGETIVLPNELFEKIILKIYPCHGCDKNRK